MTIEEMLEEMTEAAKEEQKERDAWFAAHGMGSEQFPPPSVEVPGKPIKRQRPGGGIAVI